MHSKNLYGARLKEARKRVGLSQVQLGVLAGFDELASSARMSQYETGKHLPDINTAERLAKGLNTPLAYFFCPEDDLAELILLYRNLGESQRKSVLELLKSF
ncbi:helix-turn-helix domain-containing protein [Marinospirillum sp.]|uniref:helix-turn-helix domain-containing protein n=1 Tax=Marinospirillum sp. TaxID=2183934 RepID=UPI00384D125F